MRTFVTPITTPVSYTHLDVYKRQDVRCLIINRAREKPALLLNQSSVAAGRSAHWRREFLIFVNRAVDADGRYVHHKCKIVTLNLLPNTNVH